MDYFSIFEVIINILFIAGTVVLFFVLCSIFYLAKTRVAFVKTPAVNVKRILAEINLPKDSLIYDLGCGDGSVLFAAESLGYKIAGYELSLYPYLKCLIKKIIKRSSIIIYRKNFWQENLGDANAIFLFLVDAVMAKAGDKLKYELRPNTKVISYGFKIPDWDVEKIIDTSPSKTYIYQT